MISRKAVSKSEERMKDQRTWNTCMPLCINCQVTCRAFNLLVIQKRPTIFGREGLYIYIIYPTVHMRWFSTDEVTTYGLLRYGLRRYSDCIHPNRTLLVWTSPLNWRVVLQLAMGHSKYPWTSVGSGLGDWPILYIPPLVTSNSARWWMCMSGRIPVLDTTSYSVRWSRQSRTAGLLFWFQLWTFLEEQQGIDAGSVLVAFQILTTYFNLELGREYFHVPKTHLRTLGRRMIPSMVPPCSPSFVSHYANAASPRKYSVHFGSTLPM